MTEIEDEYGIDDNSVAVLKLVTNETVVSEVVEESDEFIVLRRPLVINSMLDRDGEAKIAYRVWMPYNAQDITIVNKTAMVALCIASPYYTKNYVIGIKEMLKYRKEVEADEEDVKQETKKDVQKEDNVIFLKTDKNTVH
jgi:adenine deaminase